MGSHYCCAGCDQRYDNCVCPRVEPPPPAVKWLVNDDYRVMTVEEHDKEYYIRQTAYASMAGNPMWRRMGWPLFDTMKEAMEYGDDKIAQYIQYLEDELEKTCMLECRREEPK